MLDQGQTIDQRVATLEAVAVRLLTMNTELLSACQIMQRMINRTDQHVANVVEATNASFGIVDANFAHVFDSLGVLAEQAVKEAFGIDDEQLAAAMQEGFPMTGDDYNYVIGVGDTAAPAIKPVEVVGESGEELTLTFPGGDDSIINEQGLFGFKLEQPHDFIEYLDDVIIALFQQGLISDEGSDALLDITSSFQLGEDAPDPADVVIVANSPYFTPDHVESLRRWIEQGKEGYLIQSSEGVDVNGLLLNILWAAIVIAASKIIREREAAAA